VRCLAGECGVTRRQLALSWLLAQDGDVVPIPGTKRIESLEPSGPHSSGSSPRAGTAARTLGARAGSVDEPHPLLLRARAEAGRVGGFGLKLHPDYSFINLYHWLLGDNAHRKEGVLPSDGWPYSESADRG
jgi:hypothetical protein